MLIANIFQTLLLNQKWVMEAILDTGERYSRSGEIQPDCREHQDFNQTNQRSANMT